MIWIIGCKGMLGSELARQLSENKISWIGSGSEIDVGNPVLLAKFAHGHGSTAERTGITVTNGTVPEKIGWVVNCSAYTAVDRAEDETEKAERTNTDGARNIARITRSLGAKLIHISTDYVFDGNSTVPYREDDPKNPRSVYGKTKSLGEDAIEKEMTQYYILRTSWLYGFDGKNFVYTMTKAMENNDGVNVVSDQRGTPTFAGDLAAAIVKIISTSEKAKSLFGKKSAIPYGVYHFSDSGETTWFGFAQKIYEFGKKYGRIKSDCEINPCGTGDYPTKAERPQYSVFSKEKIVSHLKIKIPGWEESLEKFMKSPRFSVK
jgi:dTDP-4-dehydrorhamnose reductase